MASLALKTSEDLFGQAKDDSGDEPAWIDIYHHARLSADAAEVFRDLKNPKMALSWNSRQPPCHPEPSPVPSAWASPSSTWHIAPQAAAPSLPLIDPNVVSPILEFCA
ncbi:hypothetical protein [Streptomyces sp. NPDC058066]|uniref:hypothetical protein n=1 Tax=Streptomyces sp. NPDC058066 TaxID=3346323 RepID=UPI0036E42DD1